ncbi:antigen like protein, partial [Clarias magur]
HHQDIMTFISIYIILGTVCVILLTAEPEISVSGPVGSTAVLPCELASVDTHTLYIRWSMKSETVFERLGERSYQGERYEGRVDVPVEELRKGNSSLVLRNLTLSDTGLYICKQAVSKQSVLCSLVYLSVF